MSIVSMKTDKLDNNIEQEIKYFVAKSIKDATGKGPVQTGITINDEVIVLRLAGFMPPGDINMMETRNDCLHVKYYHIKRLLSLKEYLTDNIEKFIGFPIEEFFCDVNPTSNTGVMVFCFK